MINIAIDGPSAAGKSTIAKRLAKMLNYRYLDTGAMYRCVAFKAKALGIELDDERRIMAMLQDTIISFDKERNIYLDGENVSDAIRSKENSLAASTVSLLKEVRADMVRRQREIAEKQPGIIMDGRDIGSVVLPRAELKIFLNASPEVRAARRYQELQDKNIPCELTEILAEVIQRDKQDSERKNSPLIKCADAIEVDSTSLSIDEVSELIYQLAIEKGA